MDNEQSLYIKIKLGCVNGKRGNVRRNGDMKRGNRSGEREREESKVMYERPKSANCESDFFLYI